MPYKSHEHQQSTVCDVSCLYCLCQPLHRIPETQKKMYEKLGNNSRMQRKFAGHRWLLNTHPKKCQPGSQHLLQSMLAFWSSLLKNCPLIHLFLQVQQSQNSCHVQTFLSKNPASTNFHIRLIDLIFKFLVIGQVDGFLHTID